MNYILHLKSSLLQWCKSEGQLRGRQADTCSGLHRWAAEEALGTSLWQREVLLAASHVTLCFCFIFTWFTGFTAATLGNDGPASTYEQSAKRTDMWAAEWGVAIKKKKTTVVQDTDTFGQVWYCDTGERSTSKKDWKRKRKKKSRLSLFLNLSTICFPCTMG